MFRYSDLFKRVGRFIINNKNYFYSITSLGIYVIALQTYFLPTLSRALEESVFSKVVFLVSVYGIIVNITGNDVGNARIINQKNYLDYENAGNYNLILIASMLLIAIAAACLVIFLGYEFNEVFLISLAIINFGVLRYYILALLRFDKKYSIIFVSNSCYAAVLVLAGEALDSKTLFLLPLLLAEVAAIIYCSVFFMIKKKVRGGKKISINKNFFKILRAYFNLSSASFFASVSQYIDRIALLPLLGSNAMVTYFSSSVMSRMLSLFTGPMAGVILSEISSKGGSGQKIKTKKLVLVITVSLLSLSIVSYMISYLGLAVLYKHYLELGKVILFPVSITGAVAAVSSLLKPYLLIAKGSSYVLAVQAGQTLLLLLCAYVSAPLFGLVGFAWSVLFAYSVQLILYIFGYHWASVYGMEEGRYS